MPLIQRLLVRGRYALVEDTAHIGAMETDFAAIKVALAVTSNAERDALIEAIYKVEQIARGLLAWLNSACVWQLQRLNGYHYELQPPEAANPARGGSHQH